MNVGTFKFDQPQDDKATLRLDRAGLETFRRIVIRSQPGRNDDVRTFTERKDAVLGVIRAAEVLLDA